MNRTHITIVNQGVDFIIDHLYEKINVDKIADHCCFSRYYYNRLFKSVTGESLYGFIKRLRLESAAFKLIKFPHISITDIAAELGYSSSNFAVVFKECYGLSPSQFRSSPNLPSETESQMILERIKSLQKKRPEKLLRYIDRQISIEKISDFKLVYERFKGNYKDLPKTWQNFCEKMKRSFPNSPIEFIGISYDDPLIVGINNCLYDLCARVTRSVGIGGENYRKIPGGTYLCYRFEGQPSKLSQIYNDLFAVWMPHRGYVMGQGLCFERYHQESLPDKGIVMDICIPVLTCPLCQGSN